MRGLKLKLGMVAVAALVFRGFSLLAGTTPVYENRGTVTDVQVDATAFVNRGIFQVDSFDQPFDTQNTLYYTNFAGASISGTGGFRFEFVNGSNGVRRAASSFINNGSIAFTSSSSSFGFSTAGPSTAATPFGGDPTSWLMVDATNIVNRGGLSVDSSGLIRLRGKDVSLGRAGVRAGEDPFATIAPGVTFGDLYRNETGVTDLYWAAGQNNVLDPAGPGPFDVSVLTAARPSSGIFEALVSSGLTNRYTLPSLTVATNVYAFTNTVSPTNWVVQMVFINTNSTDPQFKIDVKWGTPRTPSVPGAKMPLVRFTFEDIDTITTEPYTNYVYLIDNLGAMTNAVLLTNINSRAGLQQRPSSLSVTRVTPREWASAVTNNAVFKPDLVFNPNYASQQVTNSYAAYSARIGTSSGSSSSGTAISSGLSGGFVQSGIPELTHPTNLPGRVEIEADRLDMSLARFRTDGLLSVKAKEMIGTVPYKLDAEVVNVNVGRPQGSLVVSNLIQPIVRRFNGTVYAWSAVWTNQTFSTAKDPNDPTLTVTNTIDVRFHALIVDHQFITRVPVQTYQFGATAPHVVLRDAVSLVETFTIDSPSIDLGAAVSTLSNPITPDTFPSVVNLTNEVSLSTSAGLQLGASSRPVTNLVNYGALSGSIIEITALDLSNTGRISSSVGDSVIKARNLKIEGGTLSSPANVWITADDFKLATAKVNAGYEARNATSGNTNYFPGAIILDVATRLADTGVTASNVWTTYDGVRMVRKPSQGDLLGTTLNSKGNRFAEVVHTWAGADLGPSASGYHDNSALGMLILDGRSFSLFTFRSGTGSPAALYVDYLMLTNYATNIDLALNIESDFTVYFADSNIPATQLDGALGGRLRWVRDYAGALSSAPVTLSNGRVVSLNRALVRAEGVDSDGDGIENALDAAPFEPAALRANVRVIQGSSSSRAEISWSGTPGNRYRVEYSTALNGGDWQTLTTYESGGADPGVMSVTDLVGEPDAPRFYRVVEVR